MRDLEVDLKLTVLPSCLGVIVLGRPPLLEEMPGIIAIVGVRGVRRRVRRDSSRCGGRRPVGLERKRPKDVIKDELVDALVDDSRYGWERSVLPHAVEPVANQDLFWVIFRCVLATVIFSYHGCCPRLWKKKGNC